MTAKKKNPQKAGRKTVMTPTTLAKLEDGFAYGLSDVMACFYAKINPTTLYRYQELNPEYSKRKEALKNTPNLNAKIIVAKNLRDGRIEYSESFKTAMEYLKQTDKGYNPKQDIGISGDLTINIKKFSDIEGK